jgi:catechol 2,3-dioxygenase-like lactoylglutathione lyase family enzyme
MRPQPLIAVTDVEASSRWYQRLLGCQSNHGGRAYEQLVSHGQLVLQLHSFDVEHHHGPIGDRHDKPYGNSVLLWFEVDDFEAVVQRSTEMGGILAGAPANNWTRHFTGFVWDEKALGGAPNGILPATKLRVLQKAALDSCDALDGVKDGLIEDPRKCHMDLTKLQCTGGDAPDCLTPAQRQAVQKIYAGPVSARTGEQIYPGYEPGTEASPNGWSAWIIGPIQAQFGNSLFSQAVYENAPWDWRTADLDRDLAFANEKVGWILNSYSPDLRSFRAHGGKLIQYHGWGDAAIAPRDSIAYYNKVEAFLKQFPIRGAALRPECRSSTACSWSRV